MKQLKFYPADVCSYFRAVEAVEVVACDADDDNWFVDLYRSLGILLSNGNHDEAIAKSIELCQLADGWSLEGRDLVRQRARSFLAKHAFVSEAKRDVSVQAFDAYSKAEDVFGYVCYAPRDTQIDAIFRCHLADLGVATRREPIAETLSKDFFAARKLFKRTPTDHTIDPYFDFGDRLKRLLVPSWGRES